MRLERQAGWAVMRRHLLRGRRSSKPTNPTKPLSHSPGEEAETQRGEVAGPE